VATCQTSWSIRTQEAIIEDARVGKRVFGSSGPPGAAAFGLNARIENLGI
jgi:hypothetical protein